MTDTNVANLVWLPSNGATVKRSIGLMRNDVINVLDFGAKGDGVQDDTPYIQSAFDAAFGTQSNPHGQALATTNKPVFIPHGDYRITYPLKITNVFGGRIFGEGMYATRLFWDGGDLSSLPYSSIIVGQYITWSSVEDMTLEHSDQGAYDVGFYQWRHPTASTTGGSYCCYRNMRFVGGGQGFLTGWQSSANNDTGLMLNCVFEGCKWGFRIVSYNSLNWNLLNCLFVNCQDAISIPNGNVNRIMGCGFIGSTGYDIVQGTGDSREISNCWTDSDRSIACSGQVFVDNLLHTNSSPTSRIADNSQYLNKMIVEGSRSDNGIFVSTTGDLYLRSNNFSNPNVLTSFTGSVRENI